MTNPYIKARLRLPQFNSSYSPQRQWAPACTSHVYTSAKRTEPGRRCYGPPVTTVTTNHFPPGCRDARCAAVSHYFHFMSLSHFYLSLPYRVTVTTALPLTHTRIGKGSNLLFLQRRASCRYAIVSMRVDAICAIVAITPRGLKVNLLVYAYITTIAWGKSYMHYLPYPATIQMKDTLYKRGI